MSGASKITALAGFLFIAFGASGATAGSGCNVAGGIVNCWRTHNSSLSPGSVYTKFAFPVKLVPTSSSGPRSCIADLDPDYTKTFMGQWVVNVPNDGRCNPGDSSYMVGNKDYLNMLGQTYTGSSTKSTATFTWSWSCMSAAWLTNPSLLGSSPPTGNIFDTSQFRAVPCEQVVAAY